MSYGNGIGNPQQTISSIASSAATPTLQTPASSSQVKDGAVSSSNVQYADQATLSTSASYVSQALESSDTRSTKVLSLQQSIAAGSYSVSSSDIADKMIRSLLE
jgi:negative regulator of flagellin synthesis FlgM